MLKEIIKIANTGWVKFTFSTLISLILLETSGAIVWWIEKDENFYTRHRIQEPADTLKSQFLIHPYFGYVRKPHTSYSVDSTPTNDNGFWDTHKKLPAKSKPNDVVIGFFGSSVTEAMANRETSLNIIRTALMALPQFADKNIEILNLSLPASKQPQQLQILSYYLSVGQKMDIVINLDGYLELKISQENTHFAMPYNYCILADMLSHNSDAIVPMYYNSRINELNLSAGECRFSLSYYAGLCQVKWFEHLLELTPAKQQSTTTYEKGLFYIEPYEPASGVLLEENANLWYESSRNMYYLCKNRSIAYFHYLQPTALLNTDQTLKANYDNFLSKMKLLKAEGIFAESLVDIFKSNESGLYKKDKIHPNEDGYAILLRRIAKDIISTIVNNDATPGKTTDNTGNKNTNETNVTKNIDNHNKTSDNLKLITVSNGVQMGFRFIPIGKFTMGSPT